MMERLTFEGNFCDIARCGYPTCPYKDGCSQKQIWARLKRYEDTKRTPEQIEALEAAIMGKAVAQITEFEGLPIARLRELAVADQGGRVIVLPCKVGDTVYFVNAKKILEFAVVGYAVDETGISWVYSEHVDKTGHTNERTFSPDRFGKNTFFTREEAEKALAEMEGKKDG